MIFTSDTDITEERKTNDRLRNYQAQLRELAGQISLAEERERRRIASELHDGTIQNLIVARLNISSLRKKLRGPKSIETIDGINDLLQKSLQETRTLIFDLSPPVLYELGLEAAIIWLCGQYEERTGMTVEFKRDDPRLPLAQDLKVVLFQTVRELLVNAAKHARAKQVSIDWHRNGDWLELEVNDDGIGFNVADYNDNKISSEGGYGLFSIRERLNLLGASFAIESSDNGSRFSSAAPLDLTDNPIPD